MSISFQARKPIFDKSDFHGLYFDFFQKEYSLRLTLFKYLSREIWSIFFVSLLVFIFIIMATRMMGMDLLVNQRVSPVHILNIVLCLLPRVIIFSMPAACLMCVLLAFIRISSDNEIIALSSSGISLYQMLAPVIFFSLMSYLIASFIAIYGVPWGNRSYRDVIYRIIKSKANVDIKEKIFYEPFDGMVFYINSFSPRERTMKDLFVVDRQTSLTARTIVAKKGRILSNRDSNIITIHFIDGTIFMIEKDFGTTRSMKFDTFDLNIDLRDIMSRIVSREKEPKEMYIRELIHNLKTSQEKSLKNLMGIKLFEMFSIPLAIFIMGIIGAPLGAHMRAKGRTKGIVIALFIFFIYYICLMAVRYNCEMSALAPSIGVWLPDLFLLITCVFLLVRASGYRPHRLLKLFPSRNQSKELSLSHEDKNRKAIHAGTILFIGSLKGRKFHRSECEWAKRISKENRFAFSSINEALDGGYLPCNICRPR
ncbi:LptF/LptG family permease [Thermodesulfobacteriota bacterium]